MPKFLGEASDFITGDIKDMMKVKFLNLIPDPNLQTELNEAYRRVMVSGQYIGGPEVESFEQEWANYCGAKYCVSCSSGQAALELLLRLYGVGQGEHVIVPSWTATPTWKAVMNVGGYCQAVDVNPDTFLMEPEKIADRMTSRTRAALPAHLYGYRSRKDYPYSLHVIEDAAQAHGLKNLGNAAWSFYPTKNLGAYGDGGAITTDNEGLAEMARVIRDSNRLDPLQAAFLRVKLKYLEGHNLIRTINASLYDELLPDRVIKPFAGGMYHQYVIRTDRRDSLKAHLVDNDIETIIHYPIPPHRQLGFDFNLPVADWLAKTVLSLPITCSQIEIKYVCEKVNEFFGSK